MRSRSDAEPGAPGGEDCACDSGVIEHARPLSESMLWDLQRRFFDAQGIEAWSTDTVPHYVTNNAALAHAYAAVAFGYLRDAVASAPLDRAEPVNVIELGGGSGRFAFLFLKALGRLLAARPLAGVRLRYVLTDFTSKNVEFWRAHDAFRSFVAEGQLDFAVFDAERDGVHLLESGATLAASSGCAPLIVIANYVFDGIRQDAFATRDGELHEGLVTLHGPPLEPADPRLLSDLQVAYTYRSASPTHYGDPDLDGVLGALAARLPGATFLFPCAALRCLGRLAALSSGRLLVLSADKGDLHEDTLRRDGDPWMAIHGSFSFSVNFPALVEWAHRRGGQALVPAHAHAHLGVCALILGESFSVEARLAFAEAIARTGPDEIFSLRRSLQSNPGSLPLEALVALVRLTRDDPRVLLDSLPSLWERLEGLTPPMRGDLIDLVKRCWEHYFPIGEDRDAPFELGMFLHMLGDHDEALRLFAESLRRRGEAPETRWNMGLCLLALGRAADATESFAMATAAGFTPVGVLQAK